MGCKTVTSEYLEKLETLSKGKYDNRSIETIKMNTYCTILLK